MCVCVHKVLFSFPLSSCWFLSEIVHGAMTKYLMKRLKKMRLAASFIDAMYMLINIQFMHINTNKKDYNIDHNNNAELKRSRDIANVP